MTAKQGWQRFLLHYLAWGGIASAGLYGAFKLGAGLSSELQWILFAGGVGVAVWREVGSTRRGAQTAGKMLVDLTAKIGGLATAIFTAPWWWR